jgi:hypothetical protein
MNITNVLKVVDENGRYIRKAEDVARHHGVHVNTVYISRQRSDGKLGKLDRLMAYDEACADKHTDTDIRFYGQREIILDALDKILQVNKNYFITCAER